MKKTPGRAISIQYALAMSIVLVAIAGGVYAFVTSVRDTPAVQAKANVDLTTEPSPAQKGNNTVRVKLTDQNGKPIMGAHVTVTFFMAAMPSMNMAEMKTVIEGTDKGGGMYEGKGDLGSGGIWQATVTARRDGQMIVTETVLIKATGGA